jgi:hypothetical protein
MDTRYIIPFYNTNKCMNCGAEVITQIFRGHGWCSDDCRKELLEKRTNAQKISYDSDSEHSGVPDLIGVHNWAD